MKNKKEAKKYNQKLIVAIITVTLVLILGTSYAFFTLTLKAEKELSVTTGIFKIDYKDQNIILLENAYPMNDTKGMSLSPYEFSIENTGDINALYDISLELKESSNLDYKVYLKENDFYDTPYLTKDMAYIASLIDTINIDFNYLFSIDTISNMDFSYGI